MLKIVVVLGMMRKIRKIGMVKVELRQVMDLARSLNGLQLKLLMVLLLVISVMK